MLKVTGSTMPAALSVVPIAVFAAAGDEKEETSPLHRDQLSLYTAPPPKSRYVEPEGGQVEETVATMRKFIEPYTDWCQGTYGNIKPKVQSVTRFGNDTYNFMSSPPKDFYPRAGVIALTGVLGLFLGRGSRIKKLVYPAGLVTLSASMYYPERAADLAKSTGDSVYERAVQTYAALEKMLKSQRPADKGKDPDTKV
ncbi:MICOS complex subunit MIC26-like [Notolabrus celidotus]|uniref:MICOS complex subunit MIC26-like n=1 Tax=Notolabrus celidotus TaxID=1203425 RepID=UPI00148FA018|nr:MICOS complex subunit MIC26-like [Notolabrus celidotus]